MENEIWKDVLDFEGLYQVSNLGRVKSLKFGKEKILNPGNDYRGYVRICLNNHNIKKKIIKVHRLVWESFNTKTDLQIDHINGIKTDNRLFNLQPLTNRENTSKYMTTIKKSSRYTGVSWHKNIKKWVSRIYINGKLKNIGSFINEEDASKAYQKELQELKASAPYIRH